MHSTVSYSSLIFTHMLSLWSCRAVTHNASTETYQLNTAVLAGLDLATQTDLHTNIQSLQLT